jgi:hypothetical protein
MLILASPGKKRILMKETMIGVQYKTSCHLFLFLAGTIFFEASPNQNNNRQTRNKERDKF